jgi:hypothetical protein
MRKNDLVKRIRLLGKAWAKKATKQELARLQKLYSSGWHGFFIVDVCPSWERFVYVIRPNLKGDNVAEAEQFWRSVGVEMPESELVHAFAEGALGIDSEKCAGLLPNAKWLKANGYGGLVAAMRKNPELFTHIPQAK